MSPTKQARCWASINQTAAHLGVTRRTVQLMIADGRLRAYRNGPHIVRLDLAEVDASMQPYGGSVAD